MGHLLCSYTSLRIVSKCSYSQWKKIAGYNEPGYLRFYKLSSWPAAAWPQLSAPSPARLRVWAPRQQKRDCGNLATEGLKVCARPSLVIVARRSWPSMDVRTGEFLVQFSEAEGLSLSLSLTFLNYIWCKILPLLLFNISFYWYMLTSKVFLKLLIRAIGAVLILGDIYRIKSIICQRMNFFPRLRVVTFRGGDSSFIKMWPHYITVLGTLNIPKGDLQWIWRW